MTIKQFFHNIEAANKMKDLIGEKPYVIEAESSLSYNEFDSMSFKTYREFSQFVKGQYSEVVAESILTGSVEKSILCGDRQLVLWYEDANGRDRKISLWVY